MYYINGGSNAVIKNVICNDGNLTVKYTTAHLNATWLFKNHHQFARMSQYHKPNLFNKCLVSHSANLFQ